MKMLTTIPMATLPMWLRGRMNNWLGDLPLPVLFQANPLHRKPSSLSRLLRCQSKSTRLGSLPPPLRIAVLTRKLSVQITVNIFHKHLSEEAKAELLKKYRAIPEEYYSRLPPGTQVVRPDVAKDLLKKLKSSTSRWDFWGWWSGPGRLSYVARVSFDMSVGFPVDYRYGWDVNHKAHRDLLAKFRDVTCPKIVSASPDCSKWCERSKLNIRRSAVGASKVNKARAHEKSGLL